LVDFVYLCTVFEYTRFLAWLCFIPKTVSTNSAFYFDFKPESFNDCMKVLTFTDTIGESLYFFYYFAAC